MKKPALILILLIIGSQLFSQVLNERKKPSEEEFNVFVGLFVPINQWNNGEFDGDSYFVSEEGGILAIPKLDTGIGWGAIAGWSFTYPGQWVNFIVKSSFSVSQSFHSGEFGGDPMDASFLMFSLDIAGGVQIFDRVTLLLSCGWGIPYFLSIKDGYIEGTERSDLTYWDLQDLNGGFGVDIEITKKVSLFALGEYRLIDFGTGKFDDGSLKVEYFGTSTWHGKLGLLYYL